MWPSISLAVGLLAKSATASALSELMSSELLPVNHGCGGPGPFGISPLLRQTMDDAASQPAMQYPTQLTQDIIPKPIHSHKDFWRRLPFWEALSHGATSIGVDVWLFNDSLLVGHHPSALTSDRTLDSLYIQPILKALQMQNPNGSVVALPTTLRNGLYDMDPQQTLYLVLHVMKYDAAFTTDQIWLAIVAALEPLRTAGYLSTWDGNKTTPGPITVIGAGAVPMSLVDGVVPRDYFWDAPLDVLGTPAYSNITADISPVASADIRTVLGSAGGTTITDDQARQISEVVAAAHARGIKARYWGMSSYPGFARYDMWRALWTAGVDFLAADHLGSLAMF